VSEVPDVVVSDDNDNNNDDAAAEHDDENAVNKAGTVLYCIVLHTAIGVYKPGVRRLHPPDSRKTIIIRAKAKFFGQKPAGKKWKNLFFCIY